MKTTKRIALVLACSLVLPFVASIGWNSGDLLYSYGLYLVFPPVGL